MNGRRIPAALAAALLAATASRAQGLATPPKNMARVQSYPCTDGETLAVTYYAGEKPAVRVITREHVLAMPQLPAAAGAAEKAYRHPSQPFEWRSRDGGGTLTDTQTGKVLKACRNATAPKKP